MTGQEIFDNLSEYIDEKCIHPDQPMSEYTSFRAGGKALCVVEVHSIEEMRRVLTFVRKKFLPYFVLGNGTNVLVKDEGYPGIAVMLKGDFTKIDVTGYDVTCGGGALLAQAGRMAADMWLTGMEWACGIPGTVGGAIRMNAGCFGSDMSSIVKRVRAITTSGEEITLLPHEMKFGYRHSLFCEKKYTVIEAVIELKKGDKNQIKELIEKYARVRREKQPLDMPNAGSIFKNPRDGRHAAQLIDQTGLGGAYVGGAMVSEKHCGFIVNRGNASATDILRLMENVQREVFRETGARLEPELVVYGNSRRY